MRLGRSALAFAVTLGSIAAAAPAAGASTLTSGHADLAIGYDSSLDEWEFAVLCQGCAIDGAPIVGEQEFEPSEIEIVVPEATATTATGPVAGIVDDTLTGASPGSTYYKLPEAEIEATNEEAPFLGWLRAGIDLGDFAGDQITLELVGVSYTGAAGGVHFSLFSADAGLGNPIPHFWMSTFDEASTVNGDNTVSLSVGPGSHSHFNLGFTELGVYEVTVRASGDLAAGGTTSGEGTYIVRVASDCDDAVDNDGDGLADFPDDPGCADELDLSERNPLIQCDDGADNDGDGLSDFPDDPGCASPASNTESPQCQNGINDDVGQDPDPGLIDFDGGASLDLDDDGFVDAQFNPATPPVSASGDPQCNGIAWRNKERSGGCGLGVELAILIPGFLWVWRRRSSSRSS